MTTLTVQGNKWRYNRLDESFNLKNDVDYRPDARIFHGVDCQYHLEIYDVRARTIYEAQFTTFEEAARAYDQIIKELKSA